MNAQIYQRYQVTNIPYNQRRTYFHLQLGSRYLVKCTMIYLIQRIHLGY